MRRGVLIVLALVLVLSGTLFAQPLSQQILQLLARVNTWTADQTFTNLTITGTCTGCGGAGGGTVTSVDLAVTQTAIFDATGGPIVGSGTLTLALDAQADNLVLAGPNGGGPTIPTFRALADADIPNTITVAGAGNVTWASVDKTGSSLADLTTKSAADLTSGELALARLTDGATAGVPLVAGGGGGDPNYAALNLASATSITGALAAANFPALTGDITTTGASLATDLSDTGVAAASYGSSTAIPTFTVDIEGRLTAASTAAIGAVTLLDGSRHSDTASDTATRGSVITGNASNQWDELVIGAAGTVLRSDGTDVVWSTSGSGLTALNATNVSTGTLALARGGSNASLTAVNGAVAYSTATAMALTAAGTLGQCLTSNGAAAPTWGACATLASHAVLSATHSDSTASAVTRGDLIIGSAVPAWDDLAIGAVGSMLRSDGLDPAWSTDGSGLTALNASSLTTGTVPLARIPTIPANQGGTGLTAYATGDLLTANSATTLARVAAVATGQVLTSAGAGVIPAWSGTPSLAEVNLTTELNLGGVVSFAAAAPTISAGFGTTPSVSAANGTPAFRIDVGTGGAATSGTIGLPTAVTGWNCWVENLTATAANDGDERTVQTSSTTTTAVVENQTISTGAAVAWTASDVLAVSCFAY